VTTATLELTREQIDANRRKVIRALKRSKNQCQGNTFDGVKVCAIGAACRALLGIQNEHQYDLYEADGRDAWQDVATLLGLETGAWQDGAETLTFLWQDGAETLTFLWHLNDRQKLTLPEIGAECERDWFGEAS
jgi:hypothetical protein